MQSIGCAKSTTSRAKIEEPDADMVEYGACRLADTDISLYVTEIPSPDRRYASR